jgi:uncharacterized protein YdhG (YjbR/CyaY superfamily)
MFSGFVACLITMAATRSASPVLAYIARQGPAQRKALKALRSTIRKAVPGTTERLSYRIPVFELDGKYLVYIAGFKSHVSLYPVTAAMVKSHAKAIAPYRHGRGTLRFALGEPLPIELVARLARARRAELRKAR